MKNSGTHAFVNQVFICLLVIFGCTGSAGMGLVWMRHQISLTANANRKLAARLTEVERLCNTTRALVAAEQDPDVLRRRNADWNLGMEPVKDHQVVRVTEDPVQELARRNNRGLGLTDRALPAISFQLAVKN